MSNNNLNLPSSYENNINLDEFTKCYICLCKIQDATMCPNCQKISCHRCIQKWLIERKNQCPHCRMPLKLSQVINIRFINELSNILENISTSKKQNKQELCKEHNITILYFCITCNESLCSDCYMFGKKHKDHEINKLDQVYTTHVELIKSESKEIQKKFEIMNFYLKSINDKIISVGSYKLEKSNELEELFDNLKNKLENKVHLKLTKLMSCKNEISDKLKFLESVKYSLDKELQEAPKSVLISKSEDLIKNLKNLNYDSESLELKFSENVNMNISAEIPSDIFPQYESAVFEIQNYKKLILQIQALGSGSVSGNNINTEITNFSNLNQNFKISKEKEFIYSNELVTNGLVWRIKVYPYGNSGARGEYISIFLELIEGLIETSKYYYKIELCNHFLHDKRFSNHSREFSSDFSNGECWGYNRFYKIENLEKEGFIENSTGNIMIRFYVRPQTYGQMCRDQKNYINTLEKRIKYYTSNVKVSNSSNANSSPLEEIKKNEKIHVTGENIRTSEEIAINNFNMINNMNKGCVISQEPNLDEENKNIHQKENKNMVLNKELNKDDIYNNHEHFNNLNINIEENILNNEIKNNKQDFNMNLNINLNEIELMNRIPNEEEKEIDNNFQNIINNDIITNNEQNIEFFNEIKQEVRNSNEINIDRDRNLNRDIQDQDEVNIESNVTNNNNNQIQSLPKNSCSNLNSNPNNDDLEEQVVITAINNKSPIKTVKTSVSVNKNVDDMNFLMEKEGDNRLTKGTEKKMISRSNNREENNINNFNLDLYDPDLSFNSSHGNLVNFLADDNNINTNKYIIQNHKRESSNISEDGSSFGSLMDSIKLIEETSFQEKNMKNLRKIEKDNDFLFSSNNQERSRRNNFNQGANSGNSANQNFIKNLKNKIDKDFRSSNDKFSDLIYNLYPENSFKFQKSNYKKYINGGAAGALSSNRNNGETSVQRGEAGENGIQNIVDTNGNEEKIRNMLLKKKNK